MEQNLAGSLTTYVRLTSSSNLPNTDLIMLPLKKTPKKLLRLLVLLCLVPHGATGNPAGCHGDIACGVGDKNSRVAETARKVVVSIPAPATSHILYHTNVARELVKIGHQVWMVLPAGLAATGHIDLTNISTIMLDEGEEVEQIGPVSLADGFLRSTSGSTIFDVIQSGVNFCENVLRNESFLKELNDLKPQLFIIENLPFLETMTVLPYKLDVPFAVLGTAYDVTAMHIPFSAAAQPFPLFSFTDDMTFWERLTNGLVLFLLTSDLYNPFMPRDAAAKYAPEKPFITNQQLRSSSEIWLVETDHILDYPKPSLPNVKLIGGTIAQQAKPLPLELQSFMDDAKAGVLIVSFGSYVIELPEDVNDKLFDAFKRLPLKVIFRTKVPSPSPDKIKTSSWLPQNDLLGHPNTRVFLSHCGKNGQYEALYQAIPLVCTPLFGDQHYNAKRALAKGFGEEIDLRTASSDEIVAVVHKVLTSPRYKQAINKASILFREQYGNPSQEAAKWLDHVMQYGGQYMRYAGQKMPAYRFLMLDVWAFVLLLIVVIIAFICLCTRAICRCCKRRKIKVE